MRAQIENHVQLKDISLKLGKHEAALRTSLYMSLLRGIEGDGGGALRILDIGCGRGELMELLANRGHEVSGIDLEPECVAASGRFGNTQVGGFSDLPHMFSPGDFDVVVSSHVLEHVDNPTGSLLACRQLHATRYVFAVPNVHRCSRLIRVAFGSSRPDHATHVFGWGRPEFLALLCRNGFEIVRWHSDRVTINPLGGSFGALLTKILHPIETVALPRLTPWLSSSLIVECRLSNSFDGSQL